jgi:hypothetical protein
VTESDDLEVTSRTLFVVGFFLELGLVLLAALLGWLFLEEAFPFELRYNLEAMVWIVAATVPWVLLALFLTSRAGRKISSIARIYERLKEILGAAIRGLTAEEIVLLSAAAGIGEEVLFRGVLQPLTGLWFATLVFGLLHALTPAYFVLACGIGAYLGWLYAETQNLLVPISVHCLYDTAALLLMRRQLRRDAAA